MKTTSSDRGTPAPLAVHADLDVSVAGRPVDVESTGSRLLVDFPTVETARVAARAGGIERLRDAADALDVTGLTVEIRVRGRTVFVLGEAARPGPVSQWAGVVPGELRLGGAVGALGREAAALAAAVRTLW